MVKGACGQPHDGSSKLCSVQGIALKPREYSIRIMGVALRARQQSISMLDTETGEATEKTLQHEGEEELEFYAPLPHPVLVGLEASGVMFWFLRLLEELGGQKGQTSHSALTYWSGIIQP